MSKLDMDESADAFKTMYLAGIDSHYLTGEKTAGEAWDNWLAEVERAAAEKALTDAAADIRHKQHAESIRQMLTKRAAALGLTAGQEGEEVKVDN